MGLRSVSLLDLDDEGTTIDPVLPTPPTLASVRNVAKATSTDVATPSIQPLRALGIVDNEGTGAIGTEAREDSVKAAEVLMGDDAREGGHERFNELGGILLPCSLNFQGPDIDHYLPWIHEVDVATMMAELSHEIEFGPMRVPLPSQGTSSAVEKCQLEKELFDVEGTFIYFSGLLTIGLLNSYGLCRF